MATRESMRAGAIRYVLVLCGTNVTLTRKANTLALAQIFQMTFRVFCFVTEPQSCAYAAR
jgi:hypothetical protein